MNKGLEALKDIRDICSGMTNVFDEDLDIIEKELKEKETQDDYIKMLEDRVDNLETTYARKSKALEIIKNIGILRPYETSGGQCWLETMSDATKITKDNYNSLKEAGL